MKIDIECVRHLLEAIAEKPDHVTPLMLFPTAWTDDDQHWHLHMLQSAGFIRAEERRLADGRLHVRAYDLTNEGHELWASMHSRQWWNQMLALASARGIPVTLGTLRPLGKACLESMLA
jgi:hypothetical protein